MKKFTALALMLTMLVILLAGCSSDVSMTDNNTTDALSYDDAIKELETFYADIKPRNVNAPLDVNITDAAAASGLASIDTFPVTVQGRGEINFEIAAATELSASAPDDWLNVVADHFNRSNQTLNGKSVSVTVRKITSGEVLTYMVEGGYRPECYIPSNDAWGQMLDASGFKTITVEKRIAGNTAGVLMRESTYNEFVQKHKDVNMANILQAAIDGELVFAYTNPYTSSTGLNILSSMLYAFDNNNPLSDTAVNKLIEYQRNAPTAAYTTAVLKNSAAKGIIDAMVMEEQAYINTGELRGYVFTPAGIRHDHPVYTFDYVDAEKQDAIRLFAQYCLNDENQKLASDKGFNRHDDYIAQPNGMDGNGYLAAQRVWKKNKNGGRPVIAVFVADISGSMGGNPINALIESLKNTMRYIDSDNYIGLVSYDDNVNINLPIGRFDNRQRAYFSGAVKNLQVGGKTATYNATLVGLKMLMDACKEVPDAKPMLFVLTDGVTNVGYRLDRIAPIVAGLRVPIYTIGYELDDQYKGDLQKLSTINEASCIDADVEGIVNVLRNLFNVNM
ncbi:substrate-binding domain-containing protein [Candidatus Saccharibacteria bacterium]|nr:substrate-binding domain-containing protein [Candidatus Saccharibacteria bacterium]